METHKIEILMPFIIELFGDWYRIRNGKPDIHWGFRIIMITIASISLWELPELRLHVGKFLTCLTPFCFFDIILNKLRGKSWDYLSTTNGKFWDRNLVRLNPWFLLVLRFLAAFIIGFVVIKWL